MKAVKIALYIGKGASHSWIWMVDTLNQFGFRNIQFITDVTEIEADILVISGGDPFAISSHTKKEGVSKIKTFIRKGGTYLGICAGTYFALKFHDNPYPWLNLVEGTISNFSANPPPNRRMPHKYLVQYRDGYVFHPVREEVLLQYGDTILSAPLYGGPGILSANAQSLAAYKGFTEKTLFLCDRKAAEESLLHTSALLHKNVGKGQLYLFGPHFEHPYYPEANKELMEMLFKVHPRGYAPQYTGKPVSGHEKKKYVRELKRWVSNGRLAAFGLETYHWKIGEKIYDPERLAYFFETSFRLVKIFEPHTTIYADLTLPRKAQALALQVKTLGPDPKRAEILLEGMKEFTSTLYTLYFSTLQQQQTHTPW